MNSLDICNAKIKVRHGSRDYNSNFHYERKNSDHKEEAAMIRLKFPTKIPVIVERYNREAELPMLDKSKFLVPQELTMGQFVSIIRNRMRIGPSKALFLLINERSLVTLSRTMADIYAEYRSLDGFLYITYASQEVFG